MASVTQLGYIGISASNIEEWEHFGTEVLGLQSNGVGFRRRPDHAYGRVHSPVHRQPHGQRRR